jgi:excisionase family DNA binding protein
MNATPAPAAFDPVRAPAPERAIDRLLLNTSDVAWALNVGLSSARGLMARGELPSLRVGDRRLVRRADLERFIEQRAAATS